MGSQGGTAGRADYLHLGSWNATCSMCGRKRKPEFMTRNWQGQYRCPEHDEPRQPQDFVRGIPEKPAAPWVQTYQGKFVSVTPTFPVTVSPNNVTMTVAGAVLGTESGDVISTESGIELAVGGVPVYNITIGGALASWPPYINPETLLWSWQSGGEGIEIVDPEQQWTTFFVAEATQNLSGVAQFVATDPWDRTGTGLVTVSLIVE